MILTKDVITGERFQSICDISISNNEFHEFEYNHKNQIDIVNLDLADNPYLIYSNSSLINNKKRKWNYVDKISKFKNPFKLILHNSDQNFEYLYLDILKNTKCEKIYTQNMNVYHNKVYPIPIGIANSFWAHGNLQKFLNVVNSNTGEKINEIYANFTIKGGAREVNRNPCYESIIKTGIDFKDTLSFHEYLNEFKTYKYCICPNGNGIDTHRLWESLYLKVVPVCIRSPLVEFYSKLFPIIIIDEWDELSNINFNDYNHSWENYELLKFDNLVKFLRI